MTMIQNEENEPYLNKIYESIEKAKKEVDLQINLDDKDLQTLKKSITNPNVSKNVYSFLASILSILIDSHKDNKEKIVEYSSIVDTLYTTHVSANLKNSIKLVTNYPFFFLFILSIFILISDPTE